MKARTRRFKTRYLVNSNWFVAIKLILNKVVVIFMFHTKDPTNWCKHHESYLSVGSASYTDENESCMLAAFH
ncbi:hypothetical protein Csa_001757 [Cucumis sativus]|nr:hypothetical protein Csa_001757 [Cucumis sativus]